jgi:hypothetical protein
MFFHQIELCLQQNNWGGQWLHKINVAKHKMKKDIVVLAIVFTS